MKAVEFIAKFGWDHSKSIYGHSFCNATHARSDFEYFNFKDGEWFRYEDDFNLYAETPCLSEVVCLIELKLNVEAWELIQNLGGIQAAKDAAYQNTMNVDGFDPSKIESAIALVEEVEKFKGVA